MVYIVYQTQIVLSSKVSSNQRSSTWKSLPSTFSNYSLFFFYQSF